KSGAMTLRTLFSLRTKASSASWMIDYGLRRRFSVKETCPVCRERLIRRYVLHPFPLPYPHGKGQWLTLDCACTKKERSKERSNRKKILTSQKIDPMPQALRGHSFANFRVDASNREAYEYCIKFTEKFEQLKSGEGLLLLGKAGVGKTHLAAAVGNVLKQK